MNRKFIILSILAILLTTSYLGYITFNKRSLMDSEILLTAEKPPKEELYQNIFLTLLYPYISNAIYNYYGDSYRYDPWDVKIITIESLPYLEEGKFRMKLEVSPYMGAHNSVGIDHITLLIEADGDVEVIDYKTIKTYELPEYLKEN